MATGKMFDLLALFTATGSGKKLRLGAHPG